MKKLLFVMLAFGFSQAGIATEPTAEKIEEAVAAQTTENVDTAEVPKKEAANEDEDSCD